MVNRFPRVIFATKTGINRILNEDVRIMAISESFYPRCYELNDAHYKNFQMFFVGMLALYTVYLIYLSLRAFGELRYGLNNP